MNLSDGRKESTIAAKGEVTTTSRAWGLEGLSGQLEMEVDSLSLSSLTPLLALAGKEVQMAGMLNAKADVKISDGQIQTLNATADLTDFEQEIGGKQTRLEKPVKAMPLTGFSKGLFHIPGTHKKTWDRLPRTAEYFKGKLTPEEVELIRKDCAATDSYIHLPLPTNRMQIRRCGPG